MPADIGTGASVTFATTAYAANVISIGAVSAERPAVDSTHLGTTTARTFVPGDLIDWGELTLTVQYDGSVEPPIGS